MRTIQSVVLHLVQDEIAFVNDPQSLPMDRKIEISLAPMLDVTTAHFRRFTRLTSSDTVLFTEMLVSSTVVHIPREKLIERLGMHDGKTVVQIGGSDPEQISRAVSIIQELGYDKFNLNCGCPSPRVQKGCFGAVLMLDKHLVERIINVVHSNTGAVMSLKIRTGVDEHDDFDFLDGFISHIKENTPSRTFYIHARKCWLKGLSPKQNRHVPLLNYEVVYSIKRLHPELNVILNGSITGDRLDKANGLDGLMVGREAINNIFVFWEIDRCLKTNNEIAMECSCYSKSPGAARHLVETSDESKGCDSYKCRVHRDEMVCKVVKRYFEYFSPDEQVKSIHVQPIMNLLTGRKGCKAYRRRLNELVLKKVKAKDAYAGIIGFLWNALSGRSSLQLI